MLICVVRLLVTAASIGVLATTARVGHAGEEPVDDKPPVWLQGFEGTTAEDSIGSLVANIDGRNEPLTVGYHKVTVDIRDQIARTVIEESFVNHTAGRLEGVFYFPLPQDASISGFGMWIGSELVEADVVEQQRAREIYETILRERRDPGLLEWTGGNLFKARVFPIEPHSEKRIKITYTQVLPLKQQRFRYSYALQSEMLRQHPRRELSLDATRDFRLLAALPDAVLGHSAGRVYPFLQNMSPVLSEIRDEATADAVVERIAAARTAGQTPVDARALDLLELLVERRSSELLNQPGPHAERALTAMRRAFDRPWSPGEPRLMADLLAGLGRIGQPDLAREQMRQLEALHQQAESGSSDRLHIGHALARSCWDYGRQVDAIDLLEAALDEHQTACAGQLPVEAHPALHSLITYLELRGHYARGEKTLFDQLEHPANQQQVFWLRQRLYRLYESARAQADNRASAATSSPRRSLSPSSDVQHQQRLPPLRLATTLLASMGRCSRQVVAIYCPCPAAPRDTAMETSPHPDKPGGGGEFSCRPTFWL